MGRIRAGAALAACIAALAAGCAGGAPQTVGIGISAEEKDAITRGDRDCDRASTSAVTDPSNHCFVHRRAAH